MFGVISYCEMPMNTNQCIYWFFLQMIVQFCGAYLTYVFEKNSQSIKLAYKHAYSLVF